MKPDTLYQNIRQILDEAFAYRYNKRVKKSCFTIPVKYSEQGQVTNYSGSITLYLDQPASQLRMECRVYRLPQTRIYVTVADILNARIEIVDYLENTIVLINNIAGPGFDIQIKVEDTIAKCLQSTINENGSSSGHRFKLDKVPLIIWNLNDKKSTADELPKILREWYYQEQLHHPLNHITTADLKFLESVDQLWSHMDCVGSECRLTDHRPFKSEPCLDILFWLQELFLYFSWTEPLEQLYKTMKKDDHDKSIQIRRSKERFRDYKHLVDSEFKKIEAVKKSSKDGISFIDIYLSGGEQGKDKIFNQIENFWFRINLPSSDRYLCNLIEKSPDEIIAFSLLALKFRFWWYHLLFRRIKNCFAELVHNKYRYLWEILWILNEKATIHFSEKRFLLWGRAKNFDFVFESRFIKIKRINRSNAVSCAYRAGENMELELDREGLLDYAPDQHKIEINPEIWNIPASCLNFDKVIVQHAGHLIAIPLVWQSFKIEICGTRFRFLKKKKRFQISTRLQGEKTPQIMDIDQKKKDTGKYQTYYKNIKAQIPETVVRLYNKYGGAVNRIGPFIDQIYIRGYGRDAHGQLLSSFVLKKDTSKRNIILDTNTDLGSHLNISQKHLRLQLYASKGKTATFELNEQIGLFFRFLTTPTTELEQEMIIMHNGLSGEKLLLIRKHIHRQFCFYPRIEMLNWKHLKGHCLYFIISEREPEKTVFKRSLYSVCRTGQKTGVKFFLITPQDSDLFFTRIYELFLKEM